MEDTDIQKLKHVNVMPLIGAVVLFAAVCFGMCAFHGEQFDIAAILFFAVISLYIILYYILLIVLYPHADRLMFVLTVFLIVLGLVVQYRLSPESALHQFYMIIFGTVIFFVVMKLMNTKAFIKIMCIPASLASIVVLVLLLFIGKESGGAKNWINVGGILFQPSELIKVVFVIVMADIFSDNLSTRRMMPAVMFTFIVIALLVIQKDLGAAMLFAGTALMMYYAASGKLGTTLLALIILCVCAYISYLIFPHVRTRVEVWLDPWATYSTSGYQIAQGLMAIASGGTWGMGFGNGMPALIPAYHTDYVFAVICEEFGIVFGICVISIYAIMVLRGIIIALNTTDRFISLSTFGAVGLIAIQSLIIIAGVIKLIPLTGITLPFVSYGGSSMLSVMALLAIVQSAASQNGDEISAALEGANNA